MAQYGVTRRELLRRAGLAAAGVTVGSSVLAACGSGDSASGPATSATPPDTGAATGAASAGSGGVPSGTIDYVSWEGYDLLSETEAWRTDNGIEIRSTYIGDQGEIEPKLKANTGVSVDLITYPQGWRDTYLDTGIIGPLDVSKIPSFATLYPFFKEGAPWLDDSGQVIGVPFTWGSTVLNYRADDIDAPTSWRDLLEPDLKGKVGWTGAPIGSIKLAGVILGFPNPPEIDKDQLAQAIEFLRELREQVRGFSPSYGDLTTQLVSGEVVASYDGWAAVDSFAAAQGGNVKSVLPEEGSASFADAYGIPPDSDATDVALAFINHALTPDVQAAQALSLSAGVVTPDAVPLLDPSVASLYSYDDLDQVIAKAPFLGIPPVESPDGVVTTREEWINAFEPVRAGSRRRHDTSPGARLGRMSTFSVKSRAATVGMRGGFPWARASLLVLPATFLLGLFFLVPLGLLAIYSFLEGSDFDVTWSLTLSNYADAFTSGTVLHLLANGLITGSITASICVVLGLPVAYLMRYRVRPRIEYLLLAFIVVSMLSSLLVRIYAWRTILGEDGVLDTALRSIGLPSSGSLLFTRTAVVIALVHLFLPYVVLVTYAALRNIPRTYLELASDLGATVGVTWRRVLLPLLGPSLLAAVFFVLVGASSDWVAPAFLGGTDGAMIGLAIQNDFTALGDYPAGAATSIFMLLVFVAIYGVFLVAFRLFRGVR